MLVCIASNIVLDERAFGVVTLAKYKFCKVVVNLRDESDVKYIHRANRVGFKAGALDAGLRQARGEFIAIFDADFVPRANILKRTIHHFANPLIGMVQVCWDHLNRTSSMLTRAQAIFLDGHFVIEQTARNRSGRWMNFNGTAGVWRRQAIDSAGGWQHDTLTEDMDLSYRAQLAGWQFVFLQRTRCPAELPPEINSFRPSSTDGPRAPSSPPANFSGAS